MASKLKFKVASHIVEDLGLNLYTSLPRVLAEYVANAHDADSLSVDITLPHVEIVAERDRMREAFKLEQKRAEEEGAPAPAPLETRTLPSALQIVIADGGHGMSREDLDTKFLVAGRRRRAFDAGPRTASGRLIMGRKGLGKLAGFGIARRVELITRKQGEAHATRIVLLFSDLVRARTVDEIEIDEERLEDGGGFAAHGTRIVLSELLHDPTKSRYDTVVSDLADHFEMIDPSDFEIRLNGTRVEPSIREHAYAWPAPERPIEDLVDADVETEDGSRVRFRYRMRFTADEKALTASRRGVRVYARKRLAAAPSLLDADTNMHGFRMTDYLDGVVEADFLDAQASDYIATDRQSLRWESPLLAPMKSFLSAKIKEACRDYQSKRDHVAEDLVTKDAFTVSLVETDRLSSKDKRFAYRIAAMLASSCKQRANDPVYKEKLPVIVQAIGHGNVLASLAQLAQEDHPQLHRIVARIVELTHEELDSFVSLARGRVKAIEALKKVVLAANFKDSKEEHIVQALLEEAPWMVDSSFGPTITADQSMETLFARLAKDLKIGKHAGANAKNSAERPDLVFLAGNGALGRILIVELKAANVVLEADHLQQLEAYMEQTEEWLETHAGRPFKVHGHLIGSIDLKSGARGALSLKRRMRNEGPTSTWRVRTFMEVLQEAERAHSAIIAAHAGTKIV